MAIQKKLKITQHHDAGHGWFAVKRDVVDETIGLKNVSRYSYQKGKTVYLEEDRDATLFIESIQEQGIDYEFKLGKHQETSPIRYYEPFSMEPPQ